MQNSFFSKFFKGSFFSTLLCLFFLPQISYTQIKLPKLFSDNAVFQQNKPVPIWGWAKPGQTLRVNFGTIDREIKANKNGKWQTTFPVQKELRLKIS